MYHPTHKTISFRKKTVTLQARRTDRKNNVFVTTTSGTDSLDNDSTFFNGYVLVLSVTLLTSINGVHTKVKSLNFGKWRPLSTI